MSVEQIRKGKTGGTGIVAGASVRGNEGGGAPPMPAVEQFRSKPADIVNGASTYKGGGLGSVNAGIGGSGKKGD